MRLSDEISGMTDEQLSRAVAREVLGWRPILPLCSLPGWWKNADGWAVHERRISMRAVLEAVLTDARSGP